MTIRLAAATIVFVVALLGGASMSQGATRALWHGCVPRDEATIVSFRPADGGTVVGAIFGHGSRGVVLAHEWGADPCNWVPFAELLAQHGLQTIVFDFRGYGRSPEREGAKLENDVIAAAHELRLHGATRVVIGGASAGGVFAAAGAGQVKGATGLMIVSSPLTFYVSYRRTSYLYDIAKSVHQLRLPLLLVYSSKDHRVTLGEGRWLLRAATSSDKQLLVYPGDLHGTTIFGAEHGREAEAHALAFIQRSLRG